MHIYSLPLQASNLLMLMAGFVACAGVCFFVHGLFTFARRRSMRQGRVAEIRSVSTGRIAIRGIAVGPYTLKAPISGKDCYLYQTKIFQRTDGRWQPVAEETLHLPFFVEDTTGRLLVEPLGAETDLREDLRCEYETALSQSAEVPPRVRVFLARHRVAMGRPLRIVEQILKQGTQVLVAGTVAANPGIRPRPHIPHAPMPAGETRSGNKPDDSVAASTPEVIRLSGAPRPASTATMSQQQKIAAALTRAGITKRQAWETAGVKQAQGPSNSFTTLVGSKGASPLDEEKIPPLVLMADAGGKFLISDLVGQKRGGEPAWRAAAMTFGGTALTVLGCYVLFGSRLR